MELARLAPAKVEKDCRTRESLSRIPQDFSELVLLIANYFHQRTTSGIVEGIKRRDQTHQTQSLRTEATFPIFGSESLPRFLSKIHTHTEVG